MRAFRIAVMGCVLACAACGGSSTTAPSTTTTTTTTADLSVASPTATETFNGTLAVGGARFYSFPVAQNGTINVTLLSISGANVPASAQVGLGIGTPAGTDCSTTSTVTT